MTNKTKPETWKAITEKVNAVGVAAGRTIYELNQKLKGLFSTAKKEFSKTVTGRPSFFRRFIPGIAIYHYLAKCNKFIPD